MELRHLRYFIAVAEAGSLTVAAEKKLHTAQPPLSRQIRDLEYEVGVPLLNRSVHGVELTAAGRAFLDHARLALTQAEAAAEAARRAAQRAKPTFAMGFQTGRKSIGCLGPQAFFATNCSISKSGFRATTRQPSQTTCSAGRLISLSSAGSTSPISNTKQ